MKGKLKTKQADKRSGLRDALIQRELSHAIVDHRIPPGTVPCSHGEHMEIAGALKHRDAGKAAQLVEQNSRMALRISQRAYALTTGAIALSRNSADLLNDERVKKLYLGGEL